MQVQTQPIDLSKVYALEQQYQGWDRYEREQYHVVITSDAFSFTFYLTNIASGGSAAGMVFGYPKFGLLFNGVERATYVRKGTERQGVLAGALVNEADGECKSELVGYDSKGGRTTLATFWLWIDRKGGAKNSPNVVIQNGTFDWVHPANTPENIDRFVPTEYAAVVVPKSAFVPVAKPLTPRVPVPFATALPGSKLVRVDYAPSSDGDTMNEHRPCVTTRGITIADNQQPYYTVEWIRDYPTLPHLDGERGIASCYMPTHLSIGHNYGVYGFDHVSFWRMDSTGKKTTLAGLRHKYAPYWAEAKKGGPEVEVIGNFLDGLGPMIECWAFCWWKKSLAIDTTAAPIGGRQPHVKPGPAGFACDRSGWVVRIQFAWNDAKAPPTITKFCKAADAWGIEEIDDVVYVGERDLHRISKWDAATGKYLGDLIANPNGVNLGHVDQPSRRWTWNGSTYNTVTSGQAAAAVHGEPILAPEGLAIQDGWVYYAAYALGEVRRVDMATGKIVQVVCRPNMADWITQAHYIYIAISDGTFGPRGTVFTTTFNITNFGRPQAFLPTAGKAADGTPLTNAVEWMWADHAYDVIEGAGGKTATGGYPMACAVGQGMLACGSSSKGLAVFMQAGPNDIAPDYARMKRGARVYRGKHYELIHGQFGYGYTNIPLPWGEDPDMDYWLAQCGHAQPGATAPVDPTPPPANPPPDAPPTGPSMFKSTTVIRGVFSDYAYNATVAGQRVEVVLHASSGGYDTSSPDPNYPQYGKGDRFTSICDLSGGVVDNMKFEYSLRNGGGYTSTTAGHQSQQFLSAFPIDRIVLPNGLPSETLHSGYMHGGVFTPYTERRYEAWMAQLKIDHPECDWTRVCQTGNSMGAWGGVSWAMRHPELFAAIAVSMPRWTADDVLNYDASARIAPPTGLKCDDGTDFHAHYDSMAYVADLANVLPPLFFTEATADPFTAFANTKTAIANMQAANRSPLATNANRRLYALAWAPGGHGSPGELAAIAKLFKSPASPTGWYDPGAFVLGQSYPVFDRCSRDNDINADATGFINPAFAWQRIDETTFKVTNKLNVDGQPTTTDVYLHSSVVPGSSPKQTITIPGVDVNHPGQEWVTVSFAAAGGGDPTPGPTIANFIATPESVVAGGSVSLNATVANATTVTLDGAQIASLPVNVTPPASHTYTLVATGPGGNVSATVDVTVTAALPPPTDSQRLDALEAWARSAGQPVPFTG